MKVSTLYLDTSAIGGYFDAEWMADTRELWAQARAGKWRLLTSIVAEREVQNAPEEVRQHFADYFDASNILDTSAEIERLAEAYLATDVVTCKFMDDALLVAMASVHGIRLIVSWNFKHLVNVRREDGFNAVNLLEGWPSIRIVSPKEIIYAEPDCPRSFARLRRRGGKPSMEGNCRRRNRRDEHGGADGLLSTAFFGRDYSPSCPCD